MRTILSGLLRLLVVLLVLIVTMPWILSNDWTRRHLVRGINQVIPGRVEASKVQLSWFSDQQISGLKLYDSEDELLVAVDTVTAETSVWGLFQRPLQLGSLRLYKPLVRLIEVPDGTVSLYGALGLEDNPQKDQKKNSPTTPAPITRMQEKKPSATRPLPFDGTIALEDGTIDYVRLDGQTYRLEGLDIEANIEREATGPLRVRFTGEGHGVSGQFNVDGLYRPNATEDAPILKVAARLAKVPILQLLNLVDAKGKHRDQVAALVGEHIDLTMDLVRHGNGTAKVEAHYVGDNSQMAVAATLKDDALSLDKDAILTLQVNPTLSKLLLKDINPLLITAVSAEEPVKLTLSANGFRLPLSPLQIDQVEIEHAVLELGKVTLDNGGPIGILTGVLQAQSLKNVSQMVAWFTPQYMALHKGIVTVRRLDLLLADSIHLASWGDVNLIEDKLAMQLAVSGPTLSRLFKVGSLDDDDWLVLKMKGRPDKPDLDTSDLTKQIAALTAQEQTGDVGKLIGDLLNSAGIRLTPGSIPPPTTSPLPWAETKAASSDETRTEKESGSNVEQTIKKEVKGLLKKLFK